jgi:NAD(P)-dependent dehydrogenase (short-subunit alcohol dehydrogenase family)
MPHRNRVSFAVNLNDKLVVVTGASSGLGRHFAQMLAAQGARVAVCARRVAALDELAAEIESAGGRVLPVCLDVTRAQSVREAFAAIVSAWGTPNVLINNAGLNISNWALEQTEADWDAMLDTNLKGAFLMSTEFGRRARQSQTPGSIVNIASILGIRQAGGIAPYAVSKAGLIQLTKCLALEFARIQVRVNAIAPGYIETELNAGFWTTEQGQAMQRRIPQRHIGSAQDLDGALLLLASDASAFMTGSVIAVDGGHLLSTL